MTLITGDTFADVYEKAMRLIYISPEYKTRPRGLDIYECLNVGLQIKDITQNLFKYEDKALTFPTGYVKKEMCLYLMATNSADMFSKASSFWNNIKNSDNTINSAYGNLIFNESLDDGRSQFDWAFESLKNDKDSRQAFMRYNNTFHQFNGNKDLPCTFIQMFHIRDNKLHSTVEMRSNDIIKGTTYDIPSFILFQRLMYLKLKDIYSDLELGSYTHFANSLHAYSSDFDLIEKRLQNNIISNSYPMPNDWRCIKSDDILSCFNIKLNKQLQLCNDWTYCDNTDFYNWLCK